MLSIHPTLITALKIMIDTAFQHLSGDVRSQNLTL